MDVLVLEPGRGIMRPNRIYLINFRYRGVDGSIRVQLSADHKTYRVNGGVWTPVRPLGITDLLTFNTSSVEIAVGSVRWTLQGVELQFFPHPVEVERGLFGIRPKRAPKKAPAPKTSDKKKSGGQKKQSYANSKKKGKRKK
jgi:hypothetical protein